MPPRQVLTQCRGRALRDLIQQVSNGIENDCIPFRSVRSASIFQDGGQVLGMTLAIAQDPFEHEFTTAATPPLHDGPRGRLRVETQAEALWSLCLFCVMPVCVMPFSRDAF